METLHDEASVAERRIYNEQQLISRVIHSGVFYDIFSYLAHTYPPGRSKKGPFPLGWIYLTHVCSSLRTVALDTTALWAQHVCAFGAEDVFGILLQRAGAFPLNIDNVRDYVTDWSNNRDKRVYNVPKHYFPKFVRAANIKLVASPEQMMGVVDELCQQKSPHLTNLTLRCALSQVIDEDIGGNPFLGTSYLAATGHPRLSRVELNGLYLPISGHHLVSLMIGDPCSWQPSLSELLRTLRTCSNLESLRLEEFNEVIHLDIEQNVADLGVVQLPKLIELVLVGRSSLRLASYLIHPPLEVASVIQRGNSDATAQEVKYALSALMCGGDRFPASRQENLSVYILKLYYSEHWSGPGFLLTVRPSESYVGHPRTFGREPPRDSLGVRYPYAGCGSSEAQITISVTALDPVYNSWRNGATFVEDIFDMQKDLSPCLLGSIDIVHISTRPSRPLDWPTLLAPFASARTLIMGCDQPSFQDGDRLVAALGEVDEDGTLLLPALENIRTEKKVPWRPRDYMHFREMLAFRAARGAPVLRVCSLVEKEMSNALLKKYYDDLVRLPDARPT